MRKIISSIAVLSLFLLTGCFGSKTYSGDLFSVEYPSTYHLEDYDGWVSISNDKGKIMVGYFDLNSEQDAKDIKYHDSYDLLPSALFYNSSDTQTTIELLGIQSSIVSKIE